MLTLQLIPTPVQPEIRTQIILTLEQRVFRVQIILILSVDQQTVMELTLIRSISGSMLAEITYLQKQPLAIVVILTILWVLEYIRTPLVVLQIIRALTIRIILLLVIKVLIMDTALPLPMALTLTPSPPALRVVASL